MANKKMNDAETPKGAAKGQAKGDKPAVEKVGLSERLAQLKDFFEQSKVELKKVTWPTRKEVTTTGIAVLVLVVVMSIFLGVVDVILSKLIEVILT
jgi:preprotein translocase subunit SecE